MDDYVDRNDAKCVLVNSAGRVRQHMDLFSRTPRRGLLDPLCISPRRCSEGVNQRTGGPG